MVKRDFKPYKQCQVKASKARGAPTEPRTTMPRNQTEALMRNYRVFKSPILEYCAHSWAAYYGEDTNFTGKAQSSATCVVAGQR